MGAFVLLLSLVVKTLLFFCWSVCIVWLDPVFVLPSFSTAVLVWLF